MYDFYDGIGSIDFYLFSQFVCYALQWGSDDSQNVNFYDSLINIVKVWGTRKLYS